MWVKPFGVAVALALVAGAPGAAVAHDHRPPKALLVTERDSGRGHNYSTMWSWANGGYCAQEAGRETWSPRPPVQWLPGDDIAVRFEKRHKPAYVLVRAFLIGDPASETPLYGETPVPHELRRVEVDGEVMWEAVLSPPPAPELYLDVVARWEDRDGCRMQESAWTFRASPLPV